MQEVEVKVIELKYVTVVASSVKAVIKLNQPATLHTDEVPYIQLQLENTQPVLIPYDTEEERESDYKIVCDAIKTAIW